MNQGKLRRGVGVVIPTAYRDTHLSWAFAFKGLDGPINWHTMWHIVENKPVAEAREEGAEWALKNDAKYLFFLGDDTIVPSHTLQRFVFIMENNPSINVLGGVYFCKSDPTFPLIFMGAGEGSYWDWKVGELLTVWGVGMDCTMIRTDVFDKLKKPWFVTAKANASIDGVPRAEAWTEDLWFCLPPNQLVYGDMLDVDKYTSGGSVLSHSGRLREVLDTNAREFSGSVIEVEPKYGCGFQVTPNHPVLAIRAGGNGGEEFIPAGDLKVGDKLYVPIPSRVREDRVDWLLSPPFRNKFVEFRTNSQSAVEFRYTRTRDSSQWFPLKVDITPDLCSLAGYWVAEGSASEYGVVQFTFNQHENDYVLHVTTLLESIFGLRSIVNKYPERGVAVITCVSSALADFFKSYFGGLQPDRKIPEEILFSSQECAKAFLRCYWRGDGAKGPEDRSLVSSSSLLLHGARLMLIRLGIYTSLYSGGPHRHQLSPIREFADEWANILNEEPMVRKRRLQMPWLRRVFNKDGINNGGHFEVAIEEIRKVPYTGPVYNLKVAEDKTFNVNGFAIHNCEKLAKLGGGKLKGGVCVDTSVQCQHYDSGSKRMFQLPPNCKPAMRQFAVGDKQILDLGCGGSDIVLKDGVPVRVDLREDIEVDYRCDLRALPFKTESWDILFSMATLERFPHPQIPAVLDEWLRLLKPGGELKLIVADLESIAKEILKGKVDLNMLYGGQDLPHNFRRAGFTAKTLRTLLESKGLKVKKIWQEAPHWLFSQSIKEKARTVIGDFEGQGILKETGKMNEADPEPSNLLTSKPKPDAIKKVKAGKAEKAAAMAAGKAGRKRT